MHMVDCLECILLINKKNLNLANVVSQILAQDSTDKEMQTEIHLRYDDSAFLNQSTSISELEPEQVWTEENHILVAAEIFCGHQVSA